MPGYANTLREAFPKMYADEGLGGFYKGLVPLWLRQIPYTMMKFACFERTVELLYKYVVPRPREECTKGEQLIVTFAAGYIAGVFCAVVSHPADSVRIFRFVSLRFKFGFLCFLRCINKFGIFLMQVVSKLNQEKGASALDVLKKLGPTGVWKGLGPRIIMIDRYFDSGTVVHL